jgi:outer membrane protein assembly factor BamD
MKSRLVPAAMVLVLVGGGLACKKKPKKDPYKGVTAAQLLEQGEIAIKRGRFEDGRRVLRHLEENLPGSAEFPRAKLLLGDSFFFSGTASYPEAAVEYQSFLNYFPHHELRDYALYHKALCYYADIESAERDQDETRKAIEAFNQLLREAPGSAYVVEAKAKLVQCWRRIAEHELVVGTYYVKTYAFDAAEHRLKDLLETYPDYVDRERAYYYLGEALRQRTVSPVELTRFQKEKITKFGKEMGDKLDPAELKQLQTEGDAWMKGEVTHWREESKTYYRKLVESYPNSEWARRASERLLEMGSQGLKEELDS